MANVVLVAGMGFGDEGKGSIIDFLARRHGANLVVRYNGGAQAAHNVVTQDDKHHTFAQFGSGTFCGCQTHLSRYMLVQPGSMLAEASHLESLGISNPFDLVTIEEAAPITTRFHMAANRIKEMARGAGRHGSCGMGIGETVVDFIDLINGMLFAIDLDKPKILRDKLHVLQEKNREKVAEFVGRIEPSPERDLEWAWLTDPSYVAREAENCMQLAEKAHIVSAFWLEHMLLGQGTVLFEGAQGVLLDQFKGFMPYCTRSTTSFDNAHRLIAGLNVPVVKLGVIRTYLTRHGAGPMPTEDEALQEGRREPHNAMNPWQQNFRLGHFDMVLFRYAVEALGGVDEIALTHMDKTPMPLQVCDSHKTQTLLQPKDLAEQFRLAELLAETVPTYEPCYNLVDAIESEVYPTRVTIMSYGPKAADKGTRVELRRFA